MAAETGDMWDIFAHLREFCVFGAMPVVYPGLRRNKLLKLRVMSVNKE